MSNIVKDVVDAAAAVDPNSDALQAADAAINTALNPTPENLIADLELVLRLIKKHNFSNLHDQAKALLKSIL